MKTDSNDNAIQEQNRGLEELHQLHVDDIGAVEEEISRVELKHDGLSVSTTEVVSTSRMLICSALCEHDNSAASFLSRIP